MSASKCFILFAFIAQLVDNSVRCMPVGENNNAQAFTNYRYDNPYLRGGQIDRGYGVSNYGGYRPMPVPGGIGPGFDSNSGYVPIGSGYIPPSGGGGSTGTGNLDPGFDGSGFGGGNGGGGFGGFGGGSGGSGAGFDNGFDGSQLVGRPSGGFDGGFDGSHLGGSVVQTPNFDVRSG